MNELQVFNNTEFGSIRTMVINSEPYFVGKDVAVVLGYNNTRDALAKHVDKEDKGVAICDTLGGKQELAVINESGLYSLILSSKLPKAKAFKRWVTADVLPAIRKHGVYALDEVLSNPDMLINALQALKAERAERKKLELETAIQRQQIAEMKPKVTYHDVVLNCASLVKTSVIASDYGWSAKKLNAVLHDLGVQYKQSDIWLLYAEYMDKGYTQTKTNIYAKDETEKPHTRCWTYWTQKGRLFIYELLKAQGILPVCER